GASALTAHHRPDCHLGEDSPLGALYAADARILLLGTGYATCSAFHLGEYRVPDPPRRRYRCVVTAAGGRRWWEYEDIDLDDSDFATLGHDFEHTNGPGDVAVLHGRLGTADSRLLYLAPAVDFAVGWLKNHRVVRP
ncbi:MAG TPA: AAC(3) family N-acetyltransferase, partial [Streptomyces sp.]